jgi:predicted transposase/invertase (TIGR01784 family)
MERLDPKLDLVFKTLFVRNEALLRNMLEEVLAQPIASFTVCNPGIPGELSTDKEIVLDVRVLLKNQTRVDVEMQIRVRPGLTARLVYYAARDYADQLRRGEAYTMLTPTVIVLWLLEPLFDDLPLHSVFEFRERTHGLLLSDQLQIHLLQLSKLAAELESPREPGITRWARFLMAQDEDELDRLAKETPIMHSC